MTALTDNRQTKTQDGTELAIPVAASTTIYKGSLVCYNSGGYAVAGVSTADYKFAGVCIEKADNSAGSNGDINVRVRPYGLFSFAKTGTVTQANGGDEVKISDDQTVALSVPYATTALTGANNDLTWTAIAPWLGLRGEDITIEYRDPGAASQSLSIVVEGTAIIVNLATDTSGTITSTADLIKTALAAHAVAAAMVSAADAGSDDGSGVVTAMTATRLSGAGNICGRLLKMDSTNVYIRIDGYAA